MTIKTVIYLFSVLILFGLCLVQISVYTKKKQQNNDTAVRNRNLALLYSTLCLIIIGSYTLSMNNVSSTNHSKHLMMKENNEANKAFVRPVTDTVILQSEGLIEIKQIWIQ